MALGAIGKIGPLAQQRVAQLASSAGIAHATQPAMVDRVFVMATRVQKKRKLVQNSLNAQLLVTMF